jgi:hypothetical protein
MSDTTASLRRQIGGAGDLQSVVRTMKAVAASSIGQYENSVRALAGFAQGGAGVERLLPGKRAGALDGSTAKTNRCGYDWRGRVWLRPGTGRPV